ncbi:MAG: hypothetical protein JSV18_00605 [Candidatus Bathyarchaeota archaeon]|nr:MAG: hypothetical protein JSV18_00605 [Candidatus Bathyarchaeota archaeon]
MWVDSYYTLPLNYRSGLVLAVSRESQNKVGSKYFSKEVPAWARDNLVLNLLDDKDLKLEIMYDKKYLNGLANKPLIVIRRKR